eukprot:5907680-Pleurochrysis_carterae.AAC.1
MEGTSQAERASEGACVRAREFARVSLYISISPVRESVSGEGRGEKRRERARATGALDLAEQSPDVCASSGKWASRKWKMQTSR